MHVLGLFDRCKVYFIYTGATAALFYINCDSVVRYVKELQVIRLLTFI